MTFIPACKRERDEAVSQAEGAGVSAPGVAVEEAAVIAGDGRGVAVGTERFVAVGEGRGV